MCLTDIIKGHIFADRFGGSQYTRFNQSQLEAIDVFTKEIKDQLIDVLSLRREFLVHEPLDIGFEPCWVDSLDESKMHFNSVIRHLKAWAKYIVDKTHSYENIHTTMRIPKIGLFEFHIFISYLIIKFL